MDKRFWAIVGIVIVGFFGFVALTNQKESSKATTVSPTNNVTGNVDSKVTFMEYADFQCPACESFFPVVNQVQEKYADKVKFQFRHYPLTQLHPNAFAAARAAEAAAAQGQFWGMHDALYQSSNWSAWTQATNPEPYFEQYAKQLKLDVAKFKLDAKSSKVNDQINADRAAFDKTGAQPATPTFFLNGKQIDNSKFLDASQQPSVEAFSKVLDQALQDAAKQ